MNKKKKTKIAKFRIEPIKWELFTKECKKYRLTNSQFIRYCIDILLNMDAQKQLNFDKTIKKSYSYRKLLKKDAIFSYSLQLRKIGVNLNQAVRTLNHLTKLSLFSDDEKKEIYNEIKNLISYISKIDKNIAEVKRYKEENTYV